MDPNLLSAESYCQTPLNLANRTEDLNDGDQWAQGTSPNRSHTRKSTKQRDSPANARPRKSSNKESMKSTSTDEANGARQRGRPRLDTRDQTAAERRRTQIRLAQRAYRQRKETTISALNKRVASLELIIEKMNRTFFEFNDMATASNIEEWEPNLAGGLKMTMERFIDYSRSMAPDSEVEDVEVTPVLSARVYEQDDVPSDSVLSSPSTGQQFTPSGSRSPRNEMSEIVVASALGYETTFEMAERAELVNAESSSFGNAQNTHFNSLDDSTWAPIEPLPSYGAEIPSLTGEQQCLVPCMNVTLPPPPSYSFQETSFARRLIRSTLETAVRLMTDPNGSREDILRFCKDTFTWTTPPRCLNKLRQILSRSTHESLEFWGAPQWHIGGAGLHFPRVGIDAGSAPPPNWKSMGPTGPRRLRQAKKPVDELSASPTMDLSGIEGEWFDSNDVEQYLRTRGVYLDGQSTWAEISIAAEVPLETNLPVGSPTDSSINSTGGPQSPISLEPSPSSDGRILQTADHLWSNQTAGVPNFSDTELGILFDDSWTYSPKSLDASSIFQMNAYPKPISNTSKLYVDVEKFVKGIVDSSVCLGRTPGFRRSAVDSALHSAIQEVY